MSEDQKIEALAKLRRDWNKRWKWWHSRITDSIEQLQRELNEQDTRLTVIQKGMKQYGLSIEDAMCGYSLATQASALARLSAACQIAWEMLEEQVYDLPAARHARIAEDKFIRRGADVPERREGTE